MTDPNRITWQEFEDVVERLHRKFHKNAIVTRDDHLPGKISGQLRQIDVSVRYQLGPNELLIIVECKRHGRKIGLEEMGAFISKKADVGAHMGIMVAERGFTKGAKRLADSKGVKAYRLRDARHGQWPENITIKIFVENCTIFLHGWDLLNEDGMRPQFAPGDTLHLHDYRQPDKEISFSDFLRSVWKNEGERDGEFNYEFQGDTEGIANERPKKYRLRVSFHTETKRFSRDASLELLGLTETDGTTHTDAFKIVTQPGKQATYYSEPGFWQTVKASFAMVIKASHVIWPDKVEDKKSRAQRNVLAMLPSLHIVLTAKAGEKPISLKLGETMISNEKSESA